jgi:hypothetical protein
MGENAPSSDSEIDEEAFVGLAHPLRRSTIRYLERDTTGEATTREDVVAHVERDDAVDATDAAIRLHHVHLPRLDELGWLEYDHRAGEIQYLGHEDAGETLRQALSLLEE